MTTTQQLIKFLTDYNKWRREGSEVMPNPADIGKAIDDAIAALSAQASTANQSHDACQNCGDLPAPGCNSEFANEKSCLFWSKEGKAHLQSSQSQATGKVQVSGRNKEIIVSVDGEIQFIKQIDETPLAFSHVVRSSQSQVSDELSKVIKFLLGEGELDGLWFGDSDTDKPRPRYWWRAELRERFEALQSIPSAKGGE